MNDFCLWFPSWRVQSFARPVQYFTCLKSKLRELDCSLAYRLADSHPPPNLSYQINLREKSFIMLENEEEEVLFIRSSGRASVGAGSGAAPLKPLKRANQCQPASQPGSPIQFNFEAAFSSKIGSSFLFLFIASAIAFETKRNDSLDGFSKSCPLLERRGASTRTSSQPPFHHLIKILLLAPANYLKTKDDYYYVLARLLACLFAESLKSRRHAHLPNNCPSAPQ